MSLTPGCFGVRQIDCLGFPAIQMILYRVITVLARYDIESFEYLFLIRQAVYLFEIPEQIVHLGIVHCGAPCLPRQFPDNVCFLRQKIPAETVPQTGIKADRLDAVLERVFDFAVLAGIERSSDLLLGLRFVCSCMIVCIDHIFTSCLSCEGIPPHN